MKKLLIPILAAISLTACHDHGKPITVAETPDLQDDADRLKEIPSIVGVAIELRTAVLLVAVAALIAALRGGFIIVKADVKVDDHSDQSDSGDTILTPGIAPQPPTINPPQT